MASRTPGPKKPGKVGDMKVEETKMQPNVPNQELSTDGFTIMSESEISEKVQSAISESGASTMQDIGKVMGILKSSIPAGTADMGIVSKIVKDQLS